MTGWIVGRLFHSMARVRTHRLLSARERYQLWAMGNSAQLSETERREVWREGQRLLGEMLAERRP